ncbi:cytidyltransferase [Sulfodiicoccus acidiphilus]|uniref:Cytidyltransferase n=1 Tax=Sulfodiicoccus acidiphilus TaxID=1670455 RepID=A0A348B381_9CREN|nr:DUF357 domain-containing protein [Sulfodiicoccus acidiphilus]BBD72633.1 cytidyltransferase [Sulfodiicoccus acidiphilus]GGU05879.1 cytidyltransferase [Sulfodiicoccus acidiphilus]
MASLQERVQKYIANLDRELSEAHDPKFDKLYTLARQYREDAEHYMKTGDLETALVCASYAEGLIDAVKSLKEPESKVFVGGTFDIIHPGHIAFLREASKYGKVYVAVARDSNSKKAKGRDPVNDEQQRLEVVRAIRYVYDAFLGDENDLLKSVEKVRPDVVFLGPDQHVDEATLSMELERRGLSPRIVRMKERVNAWQNSSTTSIIRKIVSKYCDTK